MAYNLKLIKGLSYRGAVKATKDSPYVSVEDTKTAKDLVSSGYFSLISVDDPVIEPEQETIKSDSVMDITAHEDEAPQSSGEAPAASDEDGGSEDISPSSGMPWEPAEEGENVSDGEEKADPNQVTFEEMGEPDSGEKKEPEQEKESSEAPAALPLRRLLAMKTDELVALAGLRNIDISDCSVNKARAEKIYAAIQPTV